MSLNHTLVPDSAMQRRDFLSLMGRSAAIVAVATAANTLVVRGVLAQTTGNASFDQAPQNTQSSASNVEMTSDSYKPVRRAPKANPIKQMDAKQIEAFERELSCPCPCTLDVYTCRTTDFNCGISPAVHKDVQALVDGGYSGDEIMAAMIQTYGDFILMTPRKQGFNLLAWFAPFAAMGIGAVAIGALLRSWRRNADFAAAARAAAGARAAATNVETTSTLDATPEEIARLEAALRDGSR